MPSVHMLIKTSALAYDDRLRKECLSVQKIGCELSVSAIENSNENRFSYSYKEGRKLNARCFSLMTRKMFKHQLFSGIYLLEFLIRATGNIIKQKPEVVWLHDPVLVIFIPILVPLYEA